MRNKSIDILVNYRWMLACFLLVATAVLACFVGGVTRDPSMRSGIDTTSRAYHQYQDFMDHFGNEEFILIVLNQGRHADAPEALQSVQAITKGLEGLDNVTEVVSLTNLKVFRQKEGLFGVAPVVNMRDGHPALPKEEEWNSLRKALPVMDFLVSKDLNTLGFLVRTEESNRFEIPAIETILNEASSIVQRNMLPGAQYRIVGPQVVRLAVHRYNLQTAVVFGILCVVIGTFVSFYIFKTVRVAVMTYVVVGIVVVWILAFMSLTEIPLTSTTGLCFGLVLVVTLATTIRIVNHFNERYQIVQNRTEAIRHALGVVLVPCLICSTTTAVGFGTTMVSSIPMVFQLGLIMSLARIIPQVNKKMYVLSLKHMIWRRKSSRVEGNRMHGIGEEQNETIRPQFDRSITIDFQGAKITSDTGFLLLREIDERFGILGPIESELEDTRSWVHSKHSQLQMVRQRIYQIAAGYEDCNDADSLRIDPALRLAIGKGDEAGAGQSRLSGLENEVLGTEDGLKALEQALTRSNDILMRRKKKQRLIVDVDSTEDPAHGKQEHVAFNGHFGKNCFHPLFAFTSEGDCLRAKLRAGNVHSADGVLDFLDPIVKRYRSRFILFWLWGDAAFANPEVYEYCEGERVTYFIRLPANGVLNRLIEPYLTRPVGRPPKSGVQIRLVDLRYQAQTWDKERRVVAKIEWHQGELFPRIGFIVTNSRLTAGKVVKVYNGRGDVENRIKEGKNTLRWDKTSCRRFAANEARLLMRVLAYNLLHMLRQFYLMGEEVKRSMEWLIKRLIKVGAKVAYHGRRWQVHVASAFPLARYYRAVFG